MKKYLIGTIIALPVLVLVPVGRLGSNAASADQGRLNLAAIFGGHCSSCLQVADQFGTVSRTAFDTSGRRIGTQVGTYDPEEPNKMRVEMTYLVPDPEHPFGQAFDGDGNPTPLHLK